MPKIMEPQRTETRAPEGSVVPAPQRRPVEIAAQLAGENEIVVASKTRPLPKPRKHLSNVRRHRNGTDAPRLRHRAGATGMARAYAYR
ncbi:MAG: hypothetical protein QOJ21_1648 [Solirubrobacteraceae bacterium]|nr:hypothetical protein [Solirubrobacteraceae bacterium]